MVIRYSRQQILWCGKNAKIIAKKVENNVILTGKIMTTSDKIQFAMVIVTGFSVIVSIFMSSFINWFNRPKITIEARTDSNDLFTDCGDFISFKLRIKNNGRTYADNVQITIDKVENKDSSEFWKNKHSPFPPMKLYWSYQDDRLRQKLPRLTTKRLQPKTYEDCDFIFIYIMNKNIKFVSNQSLYTMFEKGRYTIHFIISCDNCNSVKKNMSFFYNNDGDKKIIDNLKIR